MLKYTNVMIKLAHCSHCLSDTDCYTRQTVTPTADALNVHYLLQNIMHKTDK